IGKHEEFRGDDPPPLEWSDLRYVFDIKEDCNGKEAIQARRDRREVAAGRCSGLAGPEHGGRNPPDRGERGDGLSVAPGGLKTEQVKRLMDLELENSRLRKAVSDLTLDKLILQEAARGNF